METSQKQIRETTMQIGDWIKTHRIGKGASLRAVAVEIGVSPSYLSDIENDRRVPAEGVLNALCARIGLDARDLRSQVAVLTKDEKAYLQHSPRAVGVIQKMNDANLKSGECWALECFIAQCQREGIRVDTALHKLLGHEEA